MPEIVASSRHLSGSEHTPEHQYGVRPPVGVILVLHPKCVSNDREGLGNVRSNCGKAPRGPKMVFSPNLRPLTEGGLETSDLAVAKRLLGLFIVSTFEVSLFQSFKLRKLKFQNLKFQSFTI